MAEQSTVLITGGGSGIGMGLARAYRERGAKVIVAGRDLAKLERVAAGDPGMETLQLDVANAKEVRAAAQLASERWPDLDVVVNNAGLQLLLDFREAPLDEERLGREIDVNLKGLIHMTSEFLPLLRRRKKATLVQVSSGLAFVPLETASIYSATKAAVHSFCLSLRAQLRETGVRVVELIPPVVETNLHDGQTRRPPRAMKLEEFVKEAMQGLAQGREEINVGMVKALRVGARVAPGRFQRIINKGAG